MSSTEELKVKIDLFVANQNKVDKQLGAVAAQLETHGRSAKMAAKEAKAYMSSLDKSAKSVRGSLMGVGFGLLFQGMAIQRFFGGLARSMMETYLVAQGQNSKFSNSVNMIAGAWEFLKYSIVDALSEMGILDFIVDSVLWLVNLFNELPPSIKSGIGVTILLGFALGSVMVVAGQLALSLLAVMEVLNLIKAIQFAGAIASMGKWTAAVGSFIVAWGPILLIAAAIAAVIGLLLLARSYTDNWGDAFVLAGWSIIRSLQLIVSYIVGGLANAIQWVVDKLIDIHNKFAGPDNQWSKSGLGFDDFQNTADSMLGGDYVQQQITGIMARNQGRQEVAAAQRALDQQKASSVTNNTSVTLNITRNADESLDDYTNRIMSKIAEIQAQTQGSPQY